MARMLSVTADSLKKPLNPGGAAAALSASNSANSLMMQQANEEAADANHKKTHWRLLALGTFFMFYLAFGASVFSAIESPIESSVKENLLEKKKEFLRSHPCLSDAALEDFMMDIVDANNRGVSIFKNGTSVPSWSFGQSFFFSSTVVTTIGYGHQTPLSSEGKVFCIFYAIVGIPMTMLLLSGAIERILIPINGLLNLLMGRMGPMYQPIYVFVLHFLMVLTFVVVVFILIPAGIFTTLEADWGYLDSLYYCFISLTTIGLGDFIPGDTPGQTFRPLYKACISFYLLLGVTAMMLTLRVFYNIPQCDFKLFFLLPSANGCISRGCGGNSGCGVGSIGGGGGTDPERIRLQSTSGSMPSYTQQVNETEVENQRRTMIVRARSRPNDDSPSSPAEEEEEQTRQPIPGPSRRK